MSLSPELGKPVSIVKPDDFEASEIVCNQMMKRDVAIVCVFESDGYTQKVSRVPYRHRKHGMLDELIELVEDMKEADRVDIKKIT